MSACVPLAFFLIMRGFGVAAGHVLMSSRGTDSTSQSPLQQGVAYEDVLADGMQAEAVPTTSQWRP